VPAQLREPITLRQLQYAIHVANGLDAREIAEAEGVSRHTVKTNLDRTRKKLGARNLPHLVAMLVSSGLIVYKDDAPPEQA
jgi:DNA-binding CsgD family transcriptional regulator